MDARDMTQPIRARIDFASFQDLQGFTLEYHEKEDTLFMHPMDKVRPGTSFDLEGEIWLRVDPQSGRIIGLEIDDFESIFLKRHPEMSKAWTAVKPVCAKRRALKQRNCNDLVETFARIMCSFLTSVLRDKPHQFSLDPVR